MPHIVMWFIYIYLFGENALQLCLSSLMSISYIANIVANFKFIHNVIITHTGIWHMNNMNNNTYVSVFMDNDLVLI